MDRITEIHIRFVPEAEQRYPTLGDWQIKPIHDTDDCYLDITVTQMPDQRYSWPIAVHELIEALLCHAAGITTEVVDAWDITGPGSDDPDPGNMANAPYHREHVLATSLEIDFVHMLDMEESDYAFYIDPTEEQIQWPR